MVEQAEYRPNADCAKVLAAYPGHFDRLAGQGRAAAFNSREDGPEHAGRASLG